MQVAYKNTTEAKTAKVDLNSTVSLPTTGAASSGRSAGATNLNITGQGVIDFENQAADFTAQTSIGDFEGRQIGNTIYYKLPERLTSQQKAGQKPWIKLDLDTMAQKQLGTDFSGLQGGNDATTDPTQQLNYLQGVSDSVEEVGTEEVHGAPATHYKANIDLEKAAQQESATTQQEGTQLRQTYDQLEQQLGTNMLPVDVWLDDQGRIVRFEMNLSVSIPAAVSKNANQQGGGGQQGQVSITEELYDFGTPVSVEAPPEDQTSEITDLPTPAQQKRKQG